MKDKFIKTSGLFFIATMISNIINYLFQITMGRMLPVEHYGEMNSLFSISMLLSMMFVPATNYFSRNTAHFFALQENGKIHSLFIFAYSKFGIVFVAFILLISSLSYLISKYIHTDTFLVVLIFIFGIISVSNVINNGIIQGLHNFKLLSLIIILLSFSKYIFSLIFVFINLEVYGVLYGTLLSGIFVGLFSFFSIKNRYINRWEKEEITITKASIINYLLPMILANVLFGGLTQCDLVLVKHFFSPYDAGIYASAAVIGKAVMYLPGAMVFSLFPMVSAENAKNKRTLHLLFKALSMNTVLAGFGVIILLTMPDLIVKILFGPKYIPAVSIVGFFSLVMFFMGLILIFMNYFLALGEVRFVFALLGSLIIEIGGIYFFHTELKQVLFLMLIAGIFSCIIFVGFVFWENKRLIQKV